MKDDGKWLWNNMHNKTLQNVKHYAGYCDIWRILKVTI